LAFLPAANAIAAPLNPATFDESVGIYSQQKTGASLAAPDTVNLSYTDAVRTGSGSAIANATWPTSAEARLSLSGASFGGTAAVENIFEFRVDALPGGLPQQSVPILFSVTGTVTVAGNGNHNFGDDLYRSFVRITTPFGQWQASNCTFSECTTGTFALNVQNQRVNIAVGVAQRIDIYVSTHGHHIGPGLTFSGDSVLTPSFVIDPAFANRDQYQLSFSPGIALAAAVPEPMTWLMMTFGVLFAWAASRRRTPDAACLSG
jgi:hypothetical protein